MSSRQPRHILRSILRLVKTPPLPKELLLKHSANQAQYNNNVRSLLLREYRSQQAMTENSKETKTKDTTRLMMRYQEMLSNLNERQKLYDLDQGAEEQFSPKELSRRAAARAGLQLPETFN
jgi:hypothetical protein